MPKTRGPRTPHERARDAARSAATRLEKTNDDELHAVATMLRFSFGQGWDDPRQVEEAAAARSLLHIKWEIIRELDARRMSDDLLERVATLEVVAARARRDLGLDRPELELVKG